VGDGGWWPEGRPDDEQEEEGKGSDGERKPPRGLASRDRPRVASRYSMFVGLAFVALIAIALINTLRTDEGGILGVGEIERGLPLAEFAVPDATSDVEADANVAQDDCETSRNPCPDDQIRTPACEVDVPDAIRVCDYFDRPLAISFWFTRGGDCIETQDAFDQVAKRYRGQVNFLSIDVRDDRDAVRDIIAERGWRVPVGFDADGAVSNIYRVGVCPTILLAYPGGILYDARIQAGNFSVGDIDSMIGDLLSASRRQVGATR
jgi:thiol-disulfide isomerase/thioredoxin